jgi:alpha-1,3-rhamnosyl/mannosyltransferase
MLASMIRLHPSRIAATGRWLWALLSMIRARRRTAGLTVAVDATPLWGHRTGIGWYLHCLLVELAERKDLQLRLYGPSIYVHPEDAAPSGDLPSGPAITQVVHHVPDDLAVSRDGLLRVLRALEPLLIAADGNRVVFAPNFVPPPKFRWSRGALVVTVHDLSLRFFGWTLHEETHRSLAARLERTLSRAQMVLTDAEAVRHELIAEGMRTPDALRAIHLGPGHLGPATADVLPPNVPQRFALHVGTLEPRKNLPMLMRAWEQLHASPRAILPLVLCGAVGWKNDDLAPILVRGESEGWLINLGYVSDAVLAALYARAMLVCCPSLYEGFGFPVVEAMKAGTPVVASDIPVHREMGGPAAVFLPSDDPARWAAEVAALASNEDRRHDLSERGRQRAAEFSWQRTASGTAAAWAAAAQM